MTVLIVEQKVREVLKIAHRVYVLRTGQVSFTGSADDLKDDAKLGDVYPVNFGLAAHSRIALCCCQLVDCREDVIQLTGDRRFIAKRMFIHKPSETEGGSI